MSCTICSMCKRTIHDHGYNIQTHRTQHSNLTLDTFFKSLHTNMPSPIEGYVCSQCLSLLDQLDLAELTYHRLRMRILDYFDDHPTIPSALQSFDDDVKENTATYTHLEHTTKEIEGKLVHTERQHTVPESRHAQTSSRIHIRSLIEPSDALPPEFDNNAKERGDEESDDMAAKSQGRKRSGKDALKPFECDQCWKRWRTHADLKKHCSAHANERPYICEVCGQAYKQKGALKIHVGMHSGINPFRCTYCEKTFTQKGALNRHLPIHTGETPYQCDLCGKRFIHHTSFNFHKLSHSGEKSYKCVTCGLGLLSSSHLKRHMRVHTGERRYACAVCGKRFGERYNLMSHQKLHDNSDKMDRAAAKVCHE